MTTPSDEVDELIAAWQRERPDLSLDPMAVLSRVTRVGHVLAAARRAVFAAHDLQIAEFDVLAALRRSGAPYQLTAGALTRLNHVTSGTMTNRIDGLVARGWVQRDTDPSDGRAVLVRLLAPGRDVVDAALADLLASEEHHLAGLTPTDRAELARLLRTLLLTMTGTADAQPAHRLT